MSQGELEEVKPYNHRGTHMDRDKLRKRECEKKRNRERERK